MTEHAPIIIKRKKVVAGGGHHGGAWKVAYADFVTAMMAFFLLMWLLNATTEEQRKGLADYFNPSLPIAPISGGGRDVLNGDSVLVEDTMPQSGNYNGESPRRSEETAEPIATLEELQEEIAARAEEAGIADADARVLVKQTTEGTVIELVDAEGQPLFKLGSAAPSDQLQKLIESTAAVAQETGAPIKIVGHTDALSFRFGRYTNWELSADRANTARQLLVGAGISPDQIVEISGMADRVPLTDNPNDPVNRRIAIVLRGFNAS